MCTSVSAPDFFFSNAGKPYYATDIDPGTVGALHAGTSYTAKVTVHNSGVAAPATVRLYVCPPGTSVTAGTALLIGEANTAVPVPACSGANDGTRTGAGASSPADWTFSWDPADFFTVSAGSPAVHMCLFAQVRYDGSLLGTSPTSYPGNSNPSTAQNAQHNIDVVDIVYPLKKRAQAQQFFAFGIANPSKKDLVGEIAVQVIRPQSRELEAMLGGSRRLAKLLDQGALRVPEAAAVALGKERLVAAHQVDEATPDRKVRARAALGVRRFGTTGELDAATFAALKEGAVRGKRAVSLVPGEVRQGLLQVTLPPKAKPGELFVLDVRHQITKGRSAKVIGGLVVVFRAVAEGPGEGRRGLLGTAR